MTIDLDKSGRIPQTNSVYLGPTLGWKYIDKPIDVEFVVQGPGGGGFISGGFKGTLQMPEWLYIYSWAIQSDTQGSVEFDIYRISYTQAQAQTPIDDPANSITGSVQPTLTNAYFAEGVADSSFTGWTRNLDQNDMIGITCLGTPAIIRATLILRCVTLKGVW